jgi:hypothetical protein
MQTLSGIIKRILKYRTPELFSTAYGPVVFKEIGPEDTIVVQDSGGQIWRFDCMGRIHPKGMCLLFPASKESWEVYEKRVTDEYYESLMRIGDVCLVKSDEGTEWKLAIYDGKFDGKFKAKVGVDSETFPYCISYAENSGYLGRAAFPDWMLSEGSEIETP